MTPRTIALIGAICVTFGWLLASTVAPPVARVQSLPRAARAPAAADVPAPFSAEQLRWGVKRIAPAPAGRRNPFTFAEPAGEVPAHETARRPRDTAPLVALDTAPMAPAGPAFHLAGLGIHGDERTAVIALGAEVHIVRPGDAVHGYRVDEIGEASVTLSRGGEQILLRLSQ